jgi:hypothetical protein
MSSPLAVITAATLLIAACGSSPASPSASLPTATAVASDSPDTPLPTPQPSEATAIAPESVAKVIVDELRVREGASLDAKVVGRLSRGDLVFVHR